MLLTPTSPRICCHMQFVLDIVSPLRDISSTFLLLSYPSLSSFSSKRKLEAQQPKKMGCTAIYGKKKWEKLCIPLICFLIKASPISTNKGSEGSRRYVQHQRGSPSTVFLGAIIMKYLKW